MSDKYWDWMRIDSEEAFLTKSDITYASVLFIALVLGIVATTLGFVWLLSP